MKKINIIFLAILMVFNFPFLFAQKKRNKKNVQSSKKVDLSAFNFRNVGPAFLSGRIADIAIHPVDQNTWYVAVGSGGLWKTINSGTTWTPLFDEQSSYSTGCVTIDSNNPSTVWLGTGENVGGRHVAYGDGIYRSDDGGKSWKNMGLKNSEHISEILVHPHNSDIVWVAVQGPLWNKGGERGFYKTSNGGKTWKKTLGNNTWTGVTDIMIDPRNPDVLYAATWDRHRTVAALMGGGPGSGIFKSLDGGETWKKLYRGLPNDRDSNGDGEINEDDDPVINMGKIGLAISPQDPDVVYAAIELQRTKGGVYRSEDQGESWKKMSDAVAGATGPHYYQELYASPHKFDRLYLMNNRVLTSEDGGDNFVQLKEKDKHSDNHVILFKDDDPDYLMIGTDAGIYESFDLAETWRYIKNLPLTQFYKVAVNNQKPFYHIFGGTQDNGSAGGPSATDEIEGISNNHWYKTLGADGHQSATDPEFNNIIYAETQKGGMHRVDLITGDQVFIQPQPGMNDPYERYNWDAPIIVSPHKPSRIYFASQRVWKSDNRGDDWTPISGDLTRNEERIKLPIMGRQQSWDNPWDVKAMSTYNTITSLSESPLKEGLIYAGTDDGYIQVTSNDGKTWKKIPVTKLGLPARSFVNDIKADLFDENTVYVSLDNHKEGDFNPYLFKSTDKGMTWKSIKGNLPDRTLVWRMVQDPVVKNLLFVATEFGVYTSLNSGQTWSKLSGIPNMGIRDIVIQKDEVDLVAASFGRGFYVLDDYRALREMTEENLKKEAKLYTPRPAKWYIPKSKTGNTGSDYYFAENPTFGAVFTYHLNGDFNTIKQKRQNTESKLNKIRANIPFPGWDALEDEKNETRQMIWLNIKDSDGNVISNTKKTARSGSGRIAWNLRYSSSNSIDPDRISSRSVYGAYVRPGDYNATIYLENNGSYKLLDGPIDFQVKSIYDGVLKGTDFKTYDSFRKKLLAFQKEYTSLIKIMDENSKLIEAYKNAAERSLSEPGKISNNLFAARNAQLEIEKKMNGNSSRSEIGENNPPSIRTHYRNAYSGVRTTYGPTGSHQRSLNIANQMVEQIKPMIMKMKNETLPSIKISLESNNAPDVLTD
ncbi:MAG: glycosyl hydrolase [Flavobacteriaceae bacterium]|nr:glycosyl hydrolase [Flavobacteriaceae bacterium]